MTLADDEERLKPAWERVQMEADIRLKNEQARWEPWKMRATAVGADATLFGSVGVLIGYLLKSSTH